jgi:nickel transport protein
MTGMGPVNPACRRSGALAAIGFGARDSDLNRRPPGGRNAAAGVSWVWKAICVASAMIWIAIAPSLVRAHTIHYAVEPKGMTVRIFYAANDPASYAEYELAGPGDALPYQTGRTDRNGCVSFLPDRPGVWQVKVLGESAHGFHGVTIEVKVDQALGLESFSKPLVATHTRLITGLSLIVGIFGIYAYWRSRKRTVEAGNSPLPPS